ncbi:hypothetical protein Godav_014235 [Gossypium davidsonii]|uniref:NIF system FeS cluster assembly NifU N-terminal domain-containing protein n=2 Tax=Gossypium TaxID=3633 RepID=A0A7J8RJ42_GOSDV|nr:hypothetical protein [Gossypium davidsonii]MBA0649063.1 hypothetical protein [Gossypium klotzschianum]
MAKILRLASKRLLGLTSREIPSQPIQILPHLYYVNIIDHYNNPRNVGSFNKNDPNTNTSLVGAPACGNNSGHQFDDPSGQESWLVEEKLWPEYCGDPTVDGGDLLKPCSKL